MKIPLLDLQNKEGLIHDVVMHKLTMYRDERGTLMETISAAWKGVLDDHLPFGQTYFSVTQPGFARDESQWHNHPTKQVDRFVVIGGDIVMALYDWREESPTKGTLNLFRMGEANGDDNQYLLVVPKNVLHAFCVVGDKPAMHLGNPTHVYDPKEEGRVQFTEIAVTFSDGTPFSWDGVRENHRP